MAKAKPRPTPEKGRPAGPSSADDLQLAAPVSAVVDVAEIRLARSRLQLGTDVGPKRKELRIGHRARAERRLEESGFRVSADFIMTEGPDLKPHAERDGLVIMATFRLDYRVPDLAHFTDEHLSAFARTNGLFNAWPFWREFVYSSLARMGVPPITLPVFRLGHGQTHSTVPPARK